MERLTERCVYPPFYYKRVMCKDKFGCKYTSVGMSSIQIQNCLDKLADYEDLDERGMVIRDENDFQKIINDKYAEYTNEYLRRLIHDVETYAFDKGYNKAIDDLINKIISYHSIGLEQALKYIGDQLKEKKHET